MIEPNTILEKRYQIIDRFSKKGIGSVWIARDLFNPSPAAARVIIKELKVEAIDNEYELKGFFKEIEALERIDHEGVVKFLVANRLDNGNPYLVMEFIEGTTLRSQIRQSGIADLTRVAEIVKQLGTAISTAHDCNIHHRDLKPESIVLKLDREFGCEKVKVIDFGIATVKAKNDSQTKITMLSGTFYYMAPEQIAGKPAATTDIYAMAVIAYEMITGTMPFNVRAMPPANVLKLYELQSRVPDSILPPKALRPDLPLRAVALIMEALAFDVQRRPAQARLFGEQLAEILLTDEAEALEFNLLVANYHNSAAERLSLSSFHPGSVLEATDRNKSLIAGIAILLIITAVWFIHIHFGAGPPGNRIVARNSERVSSVAEQRVVTPILISYSISLNEAVGEKSYKPAVQLTGQEIIFHDRDLFKFYFNSEQNTYLQIINESPQQLNAAQTPQYFSG